MCPTCSATMERVCDDGPFWCPRCGTLRCDTEDQPGSVGVPLLVERCREFQNATLIHLVSKSDRSWLAEWRTRGIAEAINKPEGRP